jgi:hypothetical protein
MLTTKSTYIENKSYLPQVQSVQNLAILQLVLYSKQEKKTDVQRTKNPYNSDIDEATVEPLHAAAAAAAARAKYKQPN